MSVSLGCTLIVAAASDLMPLEQTLANSVPGCQVRVSFGSSGMLAQQIRHGADFDVFLSANKRYVDEVVRAGSADPKTVSVYAVGRIGFWSSGGLSLSRIGSVRSLAIANPQHAPYGQAAKEWLEDRGLWSTLQNRVVYGENVRQAFRYAETGNADAAIVAWSLVKDKGGQLLPAEGHKPILQTAVIPTRSRNPARAGQLINFLLSGNGQTMLAGHGFFPPPQKPRIPPVSPGR